HAFGVQPQTPNVGFAFPGGVVGFMQFPLQQLMLVVHRWPLGLQPFARAFVPKTSVAMTAKTATPSEPRTRVQREKARAGKPRTSFICGSPLGLRGRPTPTCVTRRVPPTEERGQPPIRATAEPTFQKIGAVGERGGNGDQARRCGFGAWLTLQSWHTA